VTDDSILDMVRVRDADAAGRRDRIALWLGSLAFVAGSLALPCPHSSAYAQTAPSASPSPVPIIDHITIVRQNVFDAEERRVGIMGDSRLFIAHPWGVKLATLTGPDDLDIAGWANRIHIKTRPWLIQSDLLFRTGQPLDYSLLQETERNLRALDFLRDASVTGQLTSPGHADVTVLTQDAWTLVPVVAVSDVGGTHIIGAIGISETNLFGFGKYAEYYFSGEHYRNVNYAGYEDPGIWGTHWHLAAQGSEDSDGETRGALLEYPFWSLGIPDSVGASVEHISDQEHLFSQDGDQFRRWQTGASFDAQHAFEADQELVRRIGLRYQYWTDSFANPPAPASNPALGLEPRRTSALELSLTEWHPDFVKAFYLDELGHPEDRDVGWALQTRLGYSPSVLGASRSELVMGSSASLGGHLRDETYGWLWLQTSGREGGGKVRDGLVTLEGIGYQRLADFFHHDQTLVADARADLSSGLYRDHEFVIGSGDGYLRGYPVNYLAGTRRMLFHVEDRVELVEDLLHLVSLGVAAFGDAGEVWGRGRSLSGSSMLASVGIGLRFSSTRLGTQIPLRLDFAIPLFHHAGVSPADFSTGGGQEFGIFGQPYANDENSIADPEHLAPDSEASPYPNASPFALRGSSLSNY